MVPQVAKFNARRLGRIALHAARVAVFVLIVVLIRQQHVWYTAQQAGRAATQVTVERVRSFFPNAAALTDFDPAHGGRTVVDAAGEPLGYVVQTSPQSDHIVGYSGPTNTLIAFGTDDKVRGIAVMSSGDTPEHVGDVVNDELFMHAFDGLTWDQAAQLRDVDGVSGATLTSLAVAEGVVHRLGGAVQPSYRFPDAIKVDEVHRFFPNAAALHPRDAQPALLDVLDAQGVALGAVMRTSPAADNVNGFAGPTDTLVAFDAAGRVIGIALRDSYDNQPYVRYVKEDVYFSELFNGKTLAQLADLDLEAAEVEGVSGATMTSMGVARALVKAAAAYRAQRRKPKRSFVVAARDIGTAIVVAIALLLAFTPLRGKRRLRIAFQFTLIVYLGFINGDLLAQALLVGWAQSGVPWRLAPGLVLLTAAALALPVFTKRQPYCHHLCPFGAMQELVKSRLPWQVALPQWLVHVLSLLPAALLLLVVLVAMGHLPINLAGVEPFDAFVIRIAGWATLTVAAVGGVVSLFVPMAYCRFGCPTGAMLGFLRFRAASDRVSARDLIALALLAAAVAARLLR